MNFRAPLAKFVRSRSAQMLSGTVALVLLIAQLSVMVPSLTGEYRGWVSHELGMRADLVETTLRYNNSQTLDVPESLFKGSLSGLILLDSSKNMLLTQGETLGH